MIALILIPMLVSMILVPFFKGRKKLAFISISASFLSFLISLYFLLIGYSSTQSITWFTIGSYAFSLSLTASRIGMLMAVFVSFISTMVLIFSPFYMKKDGTRRYYFEISLFIFSMLGMVLSSSLLLFYIFWELISITSYLLIGFYHQKERSSQAARKALMMTRIGDFSLLSAMILLFSALKTFSIPLILSSISFLSPSFLSLVSVLIFIAALAKSAQFPFYVWLPDAMEAPTTVTALLHSSTMITSGAFLMILFSKLILSTTIPVLVIAISFLTIFVSILLALKERDSKRLMAYSTIESMGFIFLAVSTGSVNGGLFYLFSHGIFKAASLLLIGELIIWFGTRDIYKLKRIGIRNNSTFIPMLIAVLSLSAIPPFIGFFAHSAFTYDFNLYEQVLFVIISFLTALFAFRFLFIAYRDRTSMQIKRGIYQKIPIWTLVILMLLGGFSLFVIQKIILIPYSFDPFILVCVAVSAIGAYLAYRMFYINDTTFEGVNGLFGRFTYDNMLSSIGKSFYAASRGVSVIDDRFVGAYGSIGFGAINLSYFGRRLQNGDVGFYIDILLVGFVVLLAILAVIVL